MNDETEKLTENEKKAIKSLNRVAKKWLGTLKLFSQSGTLLVIKDEIIFSNITFNNMYGSSASYVLLLKFDDIFEIQWGEIKNNLKTSGKSFSIDTRLKTTQNIQKEVVLTISKVFFGKQEGFIIIVKDLTQGKLVEKETEQLSNEVQTSLLLMNQSVKHFIKEIIKCDFNTTIKDAVKLMTRKNKRILFVSQDEQIIGVLTDGDLRVRVLAEEVDLRSPVSKIMTAPVFAVNDSVLLYEAILHFKKKNISHLAVKNSKGHIIGVVSTSDIHEMQRNSISFLVHEVEKSESVEQIEITTQRLPVLIKALIDSGARTQNITRIITSLTDAITKRLLTLAIEDIGKPPCKFAFIAVGSEGRMEQTLATDQDNAIIYDNVNQENKDVYKTYFLELGKKVTTTLNNLGFKYCNGEVMENKTKWVLSFDV